MKRLMVVCLALSSLAMAQTTVFGATPNAVDNLTVSGTLAVGTTVTAPNLQSEAAQLQANQRIGVYDFSKMAATNAASPLPTPTPYYGTELVHPDVYFNPAGWNGYRYWMAVTPYANTNSQYENPSIYASHDGKNWVTPAGLTNPVIPYPGASSYNRDPDLCDGFDGKLYMFYSTTLTTDNSSKFLVTSSSDGVNWATPQVILAPAAATEIPMSPAVVFDGKTWMMFYVDMVSFTIRMRTAASPTGTWSAATVVTATPPTSRRFWHLDAGNVNGTLVFLVNVDVSPGGQGELYLGWSNDNGASMALGSAPLLARKAGNWDQDAVYRGSFVAMTNGYETKLAIWYSGLRGAGGTGWHVGYTEAQLQPVSMLDLASLSSIWNWRWMFGALGISPGIVGDTFGRADSASSLGTMTSGHAWVATSGAMGISSRSAYVPSGAAKATINTGTADGRIVFRFGAVAADSWVMFRYVDGSNFYRIGADNTALKIQKVASGSVSDLWTGGTMTANTKYELVLSGSSMSVYADGLLLKTLSDTFNQTATIHGLQAGNATVRYTAFAVLNQ